MAVDLAVDPPFRLTAPSANGEGDTVASWRLDVDVAVEDANSFDLDISSNEVRITFKARPSLRCQLPLSVPRIDADNAVCRFSKRNQCLSVLWKAAVATGAHAASDSAQARDSDAFPSAAPVAPVEVAPVAPAACASNTSKETLDVRIEALREECRGLAANINTGQAKSPVLNGSVDGKNCSGTTALDARDHRLVKAIAAQISRLHSGGGDTANSEHLATVVDTALDLSGRAPDGLERARLVLHIGQAFDANLKELRENCFARALGIVDDAASEGLKGKKANSMALLRAQILCCLGKEQSSLSKFAEAEAFWQEALDTLHPHTGPEVNVLRGQLHQALADVCSPAQPSKAGEHREAAGAIFRGVLAEKEARAAEEALGFAADANAKRLAIQRYTYTDEERRIIIRIKLDEALFIGAAEFVTSEARHMQVFFDHNSRTAMELRIAAPSQPGGNDLVCWVLRLTPLRHPVVPCSTELRLRRGGSVWMALHKEDALPWPDGPIRT